MDNSERFWKILIAAFLGIAALTTLIILISQDRFNIHKDNKNQNQQNNTPSKGNENANATNGNTKPDPDGNVNRPPNNNNTSDLNTNKPNPPNNNSNSDSNNDRKRPGESGGVSITESYSVEALETIVIVDDEKIEKGEKKSGIRREFTIKIMPIGRAKVELTCQEIQFSARKGEEAEFTNDLIGKSIGIIKGVVSVLAVNCRTKTIIVAGNRTFKPNGTLYTVAHFPDEIDKSKDKTMLIVFEKSVSVENQSAIDSQNKTNSPAKTANDSQFMIFSENAIGNFENNKAYSFRDYSYDQIKDVYEAFEMKKWIPQVLEFYEEKKSKQNFNANEKLFPLPSPTASPSELNWEGTSLVSKHIIIENPIETPLNLTLAPPCIQQKTAEPCETSDSKWKRTGSSLRYKFESDAGIFEIDFDKQCKDFTKEKNCHIVFGYEPKKITDLTDLKIIFNHNAEKDGKLEIPLNIKIFPRAKFKVEPFFLFLDKELAIGELASESINVTTDGKVKIVQADILDAKGKVSENYKVEKNTCSEDSLLEKGDNCQITVKFSPKNEGEHIDQLIIKDEYGGRQIILLYGKGKKSSLTTKVKTSSDILKFSQQLINTESPIQRFTVTVQGPNPVEIGKIVIDDPENYRIDDKCNGKIIDSSMSCSIGIFFTPKNTKIQKTTIKLPIKILSPDKKTVLAEDNKILELSGISINTTDLVCFIKRQKKVKLNSSKPRKTETIEIEKFGDTEGVIKSVEIVSDINSKTKSDDFLIVDENCKGKSGDICSIKIGFTPRKKKIRRGTLLIKFDNDAEPIKIPISGIGKPRNGICRIIFKIKNRKLKPC